MNTQGSFCVCMQPMRDDITISQYNTLSQWLVASTEWSLIMQMSNPYQMRIDYCIGFNSLLSFACNDSFEVCHPHISIAPWPSSGNTGNPLLFKLKFFLNSNWPYLQLCTCKCNSRHYIEMNTELCELQRRLVFIAMRKAISNDLPAHITPVKGSRGDTVFV